MNTVLNEQNYFINESIQISGMPNGPLSGLTFAVKDVFDIIGIRTGLGNPDWKSLHEPASKTASIIQILVHAGATLIGITNMSEFTRGTFGENAHFGMPLNPYAPKYVPGGSSSGSACSVAAGYVDFSLGTDTIGSVRVPASFCGLFGIRPSLNRLPNDGIWIQAPSFDTTGWFTRNADLFLLIGEVLFGKEIKKGELPKVIIAKDLFEISDDNVTQALSPIILRLTNIIPKVYEDDLTNNNLQKIFKLTGLIKGFQVWERWGNWIEQNNPRMAFHVAKKFIEESRIQAGDVLNAKKDLDELLKPIKRKLNDSVVIFPTTASTAWPRDISSLTLWSKNINSIDASDSIHRSNQLLTLASALGAPQITIPLAFSTNGLPIGLSLLGKPGSDEQLLFLSKKIAEYYNIPKK